MSNLRQRLAKAMKGEVSASFFAETNEWVFSVDPAMVDAALVVFAEWLRERAEAEAERREREVLVFEPARESEGAEAALRAAADTVLALP